jgi:alcohol dehydrogenase (cytochrome c)
MSRDPRHHLVAALLAVLAAEGFVSPSRPWAAPLQVAGSTTQETGSVTGNSILSGVFTLSQASRGEQQFQRACAACHNVGEHTGRKFSAKWSGSTLGELFDLVSTTMPEGDPGSLKPEEYASILAFLLRESGYPDGSQELPADVPSLTKIRIEPLVK